jgi:hypothetical protein
MKGVCGLVSAAACVFKVTPTFLPPLVVKFRGIYVSIVSQVDIRGLPELSPRKSNDSFHHQGPAAHSDDNSIASCFPIYPGSQI